MSGGYKQIKGHQGNSFSEENQPDKRRGVSLISKLKKMLKDNPDRVTKILEAMIRKAEDGDLKAIEMIVDRIDGKPTQTADITADIRNGITPIVINFSE